MRLGLHVAVISGGASLGLKKRLEGLGVTHAYLGDEDKRKGYLDLKQKLQLKDEEILYIGDELFDIPLYHLSQNRALRLSLNLQLLFGSQY